MFEQFGVAYEAIIKVIGIGGGGSNAIENLISENIEGVKFIALDTDPQVLASSNADMTLHVAGDLAQGTGARFQTEHYSLCEMLVGADIVFVVAAMDDDTRSGLALIVAEIARELGALTVALVIEPFTGEDEPHLSDAQQEMADLAKFADCLMTCPIYELQNSEVFSGDSVKAANAMLVCAVRGIAELITRPGLVNVEVAELRSVIGGRGLARMGTGSGTGDDRAWEAIGKAILNLLQQDPNLVDASGILVNITAGFDLAMEEFERVGNVIKENVSDQATVMLGTVLDPELMGEMHVTVLATGIKAVRNTARDKDKSVSAQSCHKSDDLEAPAHPMPSSPVCDDEQEEPAIMFDKAVAFVVASRRSNPASVQREFKIRYNRAVNLIEQMEAQGIVSACDDNGRREVLVPPPMCN